MTPPCLCIIQARYASTRLKGKMLLTIGGMSLIERAWRTACEAFGEPNVVIAHPDTPENQPLVSHIDAMLARRFAFKGDDNDVLGRFHACAHMYRWHPESVIVRYTPDDPFKTVEGLRRVAAGERLPVEIGGEAFTLAMLDAAHGDTFYPGDLEHITHAIFPGSPPPLAPPGDVWTVDTAEDLERACERYDREWESAERKREDALIDRFNAAKYGIGGRCYGAAYGQNVMPDPLAALRAIQESA